MYTNAPVFFYVFTDNAFMISVNIKVITLYQQDGTK